MKPPVILVIRNDERFGSLLWESGCEVISLELDVTKPVDDLRELKATLAHIEDYDGIFFTSPAAAEVFIRVLKDAGGKPSGKIYVLGERTKRVFENAGFEVVFRAMANTASELIESFDRTEFAGNRLLFVRGDKSMRTIPELLGGVATVDEIVAYKSVEKLPDENTIATLKARFHNGEIDWICFFSPSGVDSFRNYFELEDVGRPKVAVIGDTTAGRVRETGIGVDFISHRATADDFAAGLIEHIKSFE